MKQTFLTVPVYKALLLPALALLLFAVLLVSLTVGRYPVGAWEALSIVATTPPGAVGGYDDTPWIVVEIVRLPRVLLVVLCGMGLALAGAAMQAT